MNILDQSVIDLLNHSFQHTKSLDETMIHLASNELLKGGLLSAAIWWLWFKPGITQTKVRITLVTTLISSLIAVAITRILVLTMPFRLRPIFDESNNIVLPYHDFRTGVENLSSFPSDTATLCISLAFGIYCASKRLGIVMLIYSTLFILLPRAYLGVHYMTDLIAGAFIGALTVYFLNKQLFTEVISMKIYNLSIKHPQTFYAGMFIFTYETSELYTHFRGLIKLLLNNIKAYI